ncbi:HAMP domain-containing protein [Nocardia fluminea]|uniref:histidine kinase n=1 Tax=Nocardia fluminea TaxID=134984 RepID=A0A2N3VK90_9NOCA|nr:HAMP domain-containing protein [Nocardia fluminea]
MRLRRTGAGLSTPNRLPSLRMGIRARLLTIVLVTSVVLLAVGVGSAAYLVKSGRETQNWADVASRILDPAAAMIVAFQDERLRSLQYLAGEPESGPELTAARGRSDAAIAQVQALLELGGEINRGGSADEISSYHELYEKLPVLRGAIDSRQASGPQVFAHFGTAIDSALDAAMLAVRVAPDAEIAVALAYAIAPLRTAAALARATALRSMIAADPRAKDSRLAEFGDNVGEFRREAVYAMSVLRGERLTDLKSIVQGSDWQLLSELADTFRTAQTGTAAETGQWEAAASRVGQALIVLWQDQSRDAHALADARGDRTATNSLYAGSAMILVSVLALLVALTMANQVVGRMKRLQRHTLEMADNRLPDIMRRLRAGEQVDPDREIAGPDFGTDEFGQVASAFGRAQLAAVSAAVAEAKTRAGVNAVFLNIAHRSQVVVHRQLTLLDEAERNEENPAHLDMLFQLDHLATRARRNAENLIILGGARPGRRWRNPVPLIDVVRGAVGESLDYTRIRTGRLPEVHISGNAVADLIHALAELLDNATGFSPPQSDVSVTGAIVGRGVVVEIEDQGLGMSEAEFGEHNALLGDPPDFSVAALTDDIRLGVFVVAKLAAKHGISVRLRESAYGGVQAVLLIPAQLVTDMDEPIPVAGIRPAMLARVESAPFTPHHRAVDPAPLPAAPPRHLAPLEAGPLPAAYIQQGAARPELPKRRRHTGHVESVAEIEAPPKRSADQARDRIASVMDATRKARRNPDQ